MRTVEPIRVGERYCFHRIDYQVMQINDGRVQLRSVYGPSQVVFQPLAALHRAADQGKFLKIQEASISVDPHIIMASLPKTIARKFEIRSGYILTLINKFGGGITRETFSELIDEMVKKLGSHKAPGYTTVWGWKQAYYNAGANIIALVPKTFRPLTPHLSHQPHEVQQLIKFNVASLFWIRTPFSKTGVIASIRLTVEHLNETRAAPDQYRVPSISTVYRILCELDSYETTHKQRGKKAARKQHYWGAAIPEPDRLLERVEADTRRMDIFLADENGKALGRPTLTLFIEVKTRYVIAWHISLNPASLDTTIISLKRSMSAGNPHGGTAETYIFDNGSEWVAEALRKTLYLLGAAVSYCEPGQPNQKPFVESFFRHMGETDRTQYEGYDW